jgi:hypothetical protein
MTRLEFWKKICQKMNSEKFCQLDKIEKLNKTEIKPLIEDIQMMLEEYNSTGSAIILSI